MLLGYTLKQTRRSELKQLVCKHWGMVITSNATGTRLSKELGDQKKISSDFLRFIKAMYNVLNI